jgi:hypothetical protein
MYLGVAVVFVRAGQMAIALQSVIHWLKPSDEPGDGQAGAPPHGSDPSQFEDLPYKVELWSPTKTKVEQVLAVTASGSIGYAAFHAATREFPDRYITLRHKGTVVSRWNGPSH